MRGVCSIPPGLREITYSYGMQEECTEEIWDKVWNIYLNTSAAAEKRKLLKALAQTRLVWIIRRSGSHSQANIADGWEGIFVLLTLRPIC